VPDIGIQSGFIELVYLKNGFGYPSFKNHYPDQAQDNDFLLQLSRDRSIA
jgi:hypothetical protein